MGADKFVHFRSFLIITLIALFLFRQFGGKLSNKKKIAFALICSIAIGLGDENHPNLAAKSHRGY